MTLLTRSSFLVLALLTAATAPAQLSTIGQFPGGSALVGCAYDPATSTVWSYASFGADIRRFTTTGTLLGTIPRPGTSANDADLEVVPVAFNLAGTPIPAGSLLFIDGESGVAEIYALDPVTGAVLASLATSFGVSHVVGGAFHPQRGTIFLVQDRVASSALQKNLIAEISPATGQVLGSFQTTTANPTFTVNFGDLEVTAYGSLLVVSSDETEVGEFSPTGAWIQGHPLPTGVSSLCGIGLDQTGCGLWVAASGGTLFQLTGVCPSVVSFGSACPSSGGSNTLTASALPWAGSTFQANATGLPSSALVLALTSLLPMVPPTPLSALLPEGQAGCNVYVNPDALRFLVANAGQASYQFAIPAGPAFTGLQFYHQMLVAELGALGIVSATSTNGLHATVGSY